jgi:hypothetical protein
MEIGYHFSVVIDLHVGINIAISTSWRLSLRVEMNAYEIEARVLAANKALVSQGRIDWYERVAPGWWKSLKDMLADPVWEEGDLGECCQRWFGISEADLRALITASYHAPVALGPVNKVDDEPKLEKDKSVVADKKKEARARWREKNREKLAAAEKARRAGK